MEVMSDDVGLGMPNVGRGKRGRIDGILPEGPREKPGSILGTVSRKVSLAWGGEGWHPLRQLAHLHGST